MIKKEFISFFSIPKILLSAGLFYVLFEFFSNAKATLIEYNYIVFIGIIGLTLGMFFYLRHQTKTEKKWLIQSTAHYLFSLPFTLIVYFRFGFYSEVANPNIIQILFKTLSTEIYLLFLVILYFKIVPLLRNEIQETEKRYQLI